MKPAKRKKITEPKADVPLDVTDRTTAIRLLGHCLGILHRSAGPAVLIIHSDLHSAVQLQPLHAALEVMDPLLPGRLLLHGAADVPVVILPVADLMVSALQNSEPKGFSLRLDPYRAADVPVVVVHTALEIMGPLMLRLLLRGPDLPVIVVLDITAQCHPIIELL